jgi:hypothetical protein
LALFTNFFLFLVYRNREEANMRRMEKYRTRERTVKDSTDKVGAGEKRSIHASIENGGRSQIEIGEKRKGVGGNENATVST